MKISLNFIKKFIDIDCRKSSEIAEKLSSSLTEVESVENFRGIDTVITIENKALTHRPDCFSHIGIAREIAAILKLNFKNSILKLNNKKLRFPKKSLPLKITVENKELCPRYTAIVMKDIEIKPSPLSIQETLLSSGIKPINNVVDITNLIMLELGQPLHAFDYQKIKNNHIVVRNAKRNERITTLDGLQRELKTEMLVIADEEKAIALAGIMGGTNTEVSENTKVVVIESANFNPHNIRKTGKITGLHTEATLRFEKGQDPNLTYPALIKAINLLEENAEAKIASNIFDLYYQKSKEKTIILDPKYLNNKIGIDLKKTDLKKILKRLELETREKSDGTCEVKVPSFRSDLNIPQDFVEEIARLYGYQEILTSLPLRDYRPTPISKDRRYLPQILNTLTNQGLDEVYSYSFVSANLYRKANLNPDDLLKIKNPVSPELEFLRNSLVPSILEKVSLNSRDYDSFGLFEIGREILASSKKKLPEEKKVICAAIYRKNQEDTFSLIKGVLESLLDKLGIIKYQIKNSPETPPYFRKNTIVSVEIINNNQKETVIEKIAVMGNLDQITKNNFAIKGSVSLFEIDFQKLIEMIPDKKEYRQLPKFPSVFEDLSIIISQNVLVQDLQKNILACNPEIVAVTLKDKPFYSGNLEANKKSVTFTIEYQDPEKTLNNNDIKLIRQQILKSLKKEFQAQIRQ